MKELTLKMRMATNEEIIKASNKKPYVNWDDSYYIDYGGDNSMIATRGHTLSTLVHSIKCYLKNENEEMY